MYRRSAFFAKSRPEEAGGMEEVRAECCCGGESAGCARNTAKKIRGRGHLLQRGNE